MHFAAARKGSLCRIEPDSAAAYAGLFTFLAASSFVFIRVLGLSKTEYGMVMFFNSLACITGTFACLAAKQRQRWLAPPGSQNQ